MQIVKVSLRTITPVMIGGAITEEAPKGPTQYIPPELRAPSFKGLLRFWFRALTGIDNYEDSNNPEREWFGSSERGQSPVKLQLLSTVPLIKPWDPQEFRGFDQGKGKQTRNGINYLGFTLNIPMEIEKDQPKVRRIRKYIVPGHKFQLIFRSTNEQALVAHWLALWLLCNLGGVGVRSRRGFGSLAIDAVENEPITLPDLRKEKFENWPKRVKDGLQLAYSKLQIQQPKGPGSFPFFYQGMEITTVTPQPVTADWKAVLNYMGLKLQDERRKLKDVFLRSAFGLPLQKVSAKRHASPLLFHIGECVSGSRTALGVTVVSFHSYSPDVMRNFQKGQRPENIIQQFVHSLGGFEVTL